jgi:alcohol dehydrogenase YqhD (iron-dependent ADH family)
MTTKFQLIPKYYFGKNVITNHLAEELRMHHIKTAMLVAGGGSIKRNKLYEHIIKACKQAKVKLVEY